MKRDITTEKGPARILWRILILAGWLLVWEIAALVIHNDILFAGPVDTVKALLAMLPTQEFAQSVLSSFARISLGFVLGSLLGMGLGALGCRFPILDDILSPIVLMTKSVPVASFIILLLIWYGNEGIALPITALVVFPFLYYSTRDGIQAADDKLLEMAQVFRMPNGARVRHIYYPAVFPFWMSGFRTALGMSWKAGVAAEVIGQPLNSIGNGMYRAKIYLATGELFAWTIVIVLIAWVFEKVFLLVLALFNPRKEAKHDH